jgi:hypothetical protein
MVRYEQKPVVTNRFRPGCAFGPAHHRAKSLHGAVFA